MNPPDLQNQNQLFTQQMNTLFADKIRTSSHIEFLRAGQSLIDDLELQNYFFDDRVVAADIGLNAINFNTLKNNIKAKIEVLIKYFL